jgi:hypothetical protein
MIEAGVDAWRNTLTFLKDGVDGRRQFLSKLRAAGVCQFGSWLNVTVTRCGFVRVSLGGVRDEPEIRGNQRIQSMRKAKPLNPLFLFGRGGQDGRRLPRRPVFGLAGSARPRDHYLGVDYDLSRVMFITTRTRSTSRRS